MLYNKLNNKSVVYVFITLYDIPGTAYAGYADRVLASPTQVPPPVPVQPGGGVPAVREEGGEHGGGGQSLH